MPTITVLDQATINQIAAGEVVERPSSVVKELVENSIDAGATSVTVEIREGGIGMVRITDNGCGIEREQIPTAFKRHTTSKIKNAADLLTVSSLGFRGEALSSIAAVAQVELITKASQELTGTRYQIHGGKEVSLEEVGAPEGSTILVRNLFFNTPARRKFLKSPQTEGAYISALMEKMALSRPDLSFRFILNNQTKLHSSGNHNLKDLIYMIYGREIAAQLIPIDVKREFLHIHGFIGKPVISRGNRAFENYFINGRYIRSSLICKAIEDGYHSFMMQHKYPFTVLHMDIEPEYLDVNVHPSKMELRFRNQEEIYEILMTAIREALSGKELIRKVTPDSEKELRKTEREEQKERFELLRTGRKAPEPFEKKRQSTVTQGFSSMFPPVEEPVGQKVSTGIAKAPDMAKAPENKRDNVLREEKAAYQAVSKTTEAPAKAAESAKSSVKEPPAKEPFEEKLFTREAERSYTFIGQLFSTYWLIEYKEELLIIDQHAAHEKILYEKLVKDLREKKIYSQLLNPPVIVTLNLQEEDVLKTHKERFTSMGFELEHFGGKEYAIYAVPQNLYGISEKELFLELLDSLTQDISGKKEDLILEKLASMSCKAAVKGGDDLTTEEAKELIRELMGLENPFACPHGRPTIISMSRRELEKKFKRII